MLEEELEKRRAFLLAHVAKAHRVREVDVERLTPGLGMCAHHGVLGDEFLAGALAPVGLQPILARARDVGLGR